jgi:hypothetical protein
MGAIQVRAPSTQGTWSRLARAQPRAKAADLGGFTSRPRIPSSNGRTFGSPEAQASRRSNLGQIATPTDRIAGAFNARIDWHLILTRAPQLTEPKWPQSLRRCGGQISPRSTRRMKDLTKGPRAQWIVRSLLHGPGEEQSVKQIDIRLDWCKPGRPYSVEQATTTKIRVSRAGAPCNGTRRG